MKTTMILSVARIKTIIYFPKKKKLDSFEVVTDKVLSVFFFHYVGCP